MLRIPLGLSLLWLLTAPRALPAADPGYVWVEAESGTDKLQQSNDWYDPMDRKTWLSGQDWWQSFDEIGMKSGYIVYPFSVPGEGKWRLWVRVNLKATGCNLSLDGAPPQGIPLAAWTKADADNQRNLNYGRRIYDNASASHDGSNRHTLAGVRMDELPLAAGAHAALRGAAGQEWQGVGRGGLLRAGPARF